MSKTHHIDESGHARMVNIDGKVISLRRAVARSIVELPPDAFAAIMSGDTPKGDVLAAARIAGIMAAKRTPDLIPLCHQVALTSVNVSLTPSEPESSIIIVAEAQARDQTGVEMEALTASTVAALTLYDMMKSFGHGISIKATELLEKSGGASGPFSRSVRVVEKTEPNVNAPAEEAGGTDESGDALLPPPEVQMRPTRRTPAPEPSPDSIARAGLVEELTSDDEELAAFLLREPLGAAYMLGDLDTAFAEHCQWYGLRDTELRAVLLLYTGLSMPAVLTLGAPEDVESLVWASRSYLPRRFYCHVRPEHRVAFDCHYHIEEEKRMVRMGCQRAEFVRAAETTGVEPLAHRDTGSIMQLYTHYPDNFFEPALLDTGLYFGIRDGESLISVAGLHVLSERFDVAAIGNIVTHADWRGQGLASRCVQRLLDELFSRVGSVALNVRRDNEAAIACYRKFGFSDHHPFLEAWATLR